MKIPSNEELEKRVGLVRDGQIRRPELDVYGHRYTAMATVRGLDDGFFVVDSGLSPAPDELIEAIQKAIKAKGTKANVKSD